MCSGHIMACKHGWLARLRRIAGWQNFLAFESTTCADFGETACEIVNTGKCMLDEQCEVMKTRQKMTSYGFENFLSFPYYVFFENVSEGFAAVLELIGVA